MRDITWYKDTLTLSALGLNLKFEVPHDVFSTQRIDEGTLLLLSHLAKSDSASGPHSILDMGCGYGALGITLGVKYPSTQITMVDRDLLAVEWTKINYELNCKTQIMAKTQAIPSLGFRNLPSSPATYDWILCNIPARIGMPFMRDLLLSSQKKLAIAGELRIVIINDLAAPLFQVAEASGIKITEIIRGPRHTVVAMGQNQKDAVSAEDPDLYFRDSISIFDGQISIALDRPFDLGGDDPKRLQAGLPLLLDALPRPASKQKRILCFRIGYGALPLVSMRRWPEAHVVGIDRDLLATTFTQRNAKKLGLEDQRLDLRTSAHFPRAIREGELFTLIMGELSPSAGLNVAQDEIKSIAQALESNGEAILLVHEKMERELLSALPPSKLFSVTPIIKRQGFSALRIKPSR